MAAIRVSLEVAEGLPLVKRKQVVVSPEGEAVPYQRTANMITSGGNRNPASRS